MPYKGKENRPPQESKRYDSMTIEDMSENMLGLRLHTDDEGETPRYVE